MSFKACCICNSKCPDYKYYPFPEDENLCQIWKDICNINNDVDVSNAKLCQKHFPMSEIIQYHKNFGLFEKKMFIKRGLLPTLNIPNELYLIHIIGQILAGTVLISEITIITTEKKYSRVEQIDDDTSSSGSTKIVCSEPEVPNVLNEVIIESDLSDDVIVINNKPESSILQEPLSIKVHVLELDNFGSNWSSSPISAETVQESTCPVNPEVSDKRYNARYFCEYNLEYLQKYPKLLEKALQQGNYEINKLRKRIRLLSSRNRRARIKIQALKDKLGIIDYLNSSDDDDMCLENMYSDDSS